MRTGRAFRILFIVMLIFLGTLLLPDLGEIFPIEFRDENTEIDRDDSLNLFFKDAFVGKKTFVEMTADSEWDTEAEVEAAWGAINIILESEIDTEAEFEALCAALNFIISTEIDTEAEFEALCASLNFIVSTEINTEAKFEALCASLNFIISTEIDTETEFDALLFDVLTDITGENLNDLSDVNASSPSDNDSLVWDDATGKWIPEAVSGAAETLAQTLAAGPDANDVDTTSWAKLEGYDPNLYLDMGTDGQTDLEGEIVNVGATANEVNIGPGGANVRCETNLEFEGATANAFETTFTITDPTADRTITVPDADVTLASSIVSGATVFGPDNSPTGGWANMDLSGTIGSNSARVWLKFTATTDMNAIAIREDGDTTEYFDASHASNATGLQLAHHDADIGIVLTCRTSASGIIEWQTESQATATAILIDYIK